MPHGLVHAVLNIDDTVAITENYLFVDALPGEYFIIWPKLEWNRNSTSIHKYIRTLADSGFFKNFLYQGGVKSTVFKVFEDLKFKISNLHSVVIGF